MGKRHFRASTSQRGYVWRLVPGTRAYAHLAGNGRLAVVAQAGYGDLTWWAEGFMRPK
jgi:hypothetical protein